MRKASIMAPTTRRKWLEEGIALLGEVGADGLTIEALTTRLGVTKGSFYHHFGGYQNYKTDLLDFLEEEGTLQIIQIAEQAPSPQEKLERIREATLHHTQLDVALRAWALQDAQVREYQQRIDQQRIAYLEELHFALNGDHVRALQLARLFYSIYVGSQHIIPPLQRDDLAEMYEVARPLLSRTSGDVLAASTEGKD